MRTKEERKEIVWEEYKKIVEQAEKEYDKIENPAYKKYQKIVKPASEKYQKIIKKIDKESEFNLSEKVKTKDRFNYEHQGFHSNPELLEVEDVKEFIKLLKEKGKCKNPSQNGEIICLLSEKEINELAGERLK